jgi:hypothetical protein
VAACIRYSCGYKYQLRRRYEVLLPELADQTRAPIRTEWIELDPDGTLRLAAGYAWDGPSGPTFDTLDFMRPSLGHDGLYQLLREGHLPPACRLIADKILHRHCLEDGMPRIRAAWVYLGVRFGGGPGADPALVKPDTFAPKACAADSVFTHPEAP